MNYRHGFHAANFADILKHVVLMRILDAIYKSSELGKEVAIK